MLQSLDRHRHHCLHSSHTRIFQSSCRSALRRSSSALRGNRQFKPLPERVGWLYSIHHWRRKAGPEKGANSSDKPESSSAAKDTGTPQSQEYDLLSLEELQKASNGATEGPIDATEPSSSSQSATNEASESGPLNKAISFTALQWSRLLSTFSKFLARIVAFLSWIPAVARHRKLAKLRAELQEDPSAPDR